MNINNLQIGYQKVLLEIESMELLQGKVYALVGANGRGKTTLLQTLVGRIPALSGEIKVAGKKTQELSVVEKSRKLGFVKSRFEGIPYMRAHEYVALGRTPYTNAFGRLSSEDAIRIDASLERMKIKHLAEKFTTELSDGERQMLAIAKVLAQETDYIFLDEPTAFLDYSNKKKVMEMLQEIAREEKKCVFFSSHDLEMVLDFSDEIIGIPLGHNEVYKRKTNEINFEMLVGKSFG